MVTPAGHPIARQDHAMILLALRQTLLIPAWYWTLALGDGALVLLRAAASPAARD